MFLGIEYIISRCKYVCQHDSHRSTPLIDLQKQFLETFLIGGHEEGGVGSKKRCAFLRKRGLYTEELYQNYWRTVAHLRFEIITKQRTDVMALGSLVLVRVGDLVGRENLSN